LGLINTKRSEIKKKLFSGQRVKDKELLRLLYLSQLISDYPGIVKACQIIAATGRLKMKYALILSTALFKTQWIVIRKLQELIRFLWSILKNKKINPTGD
jgi:hypothetical protein